MLPTVSKISYLQCLDVLKFICIPLLNLAVLPSCEEEMGFRHKLQIHHTEREKG